MATQSWAPNTLTMAALLTVLTSSLGLLTTASKTDGKYLYNSATVPFFAEVLKLVLSWHFLQEQRRKDPIAARCTMSWRHLALFPVPSLIYMVHNNLQFYFLKYVDPATYQILGNLKILSTGALLQLCLNRRLSLLQWIALGLLTAGAATSQINTDCSAETVMQAPLMGYLLGALSALLSGVAAVYTEWVMKSNQDSLYWQNMQLYGFGVLFNGGAMIFKGGGLSLLLRPAALLRGYDGVTWLVVANLAFSGLAVSWVMKYADSIVKVYATSLAMLLTTVVAIFSFGLHPTLQLGLGILIASASVVIYYVPLDRLASTDFLRAHSPRTAALPK
ncbi:nucleotide-sugar transporter [Helicosporidium sp. ATCC 50920]|nr:nucleotide-sugar transporter [Helicosporidium sp. ATCC 50920]|eukprot:KDD75163.1 nucleotide-sugar transporter [Helicosporidium sp. ATCC 50920]